MLSETLWTMAEIFMAFSIILTGASLINCSIFYFVNKLRIPRVMASPGSIHIFIFASIPWLTAGVSAVLIYLPWASQLLSLQHCHEHSCLAHQPSVMHGIIGASALVGTIILLAFLTAATILRLIHNCRTVATLVNMSTPVRGTYYRHLPSKALIAWTAGIFRPHILVSSGILEICTEDELRLIELHERAHIARADNCKKLMLSALLIATPKWFKLALLRRFDILCEQGAQAVVLSELNRMYGNQPHAECVSKEAAQAATATHFNRAIVQGLFLFMLQILQVCLTVPGYHLFVDVFINH